METIKISHPYTKDQVPGKDLVLVLGYFDGVHRGHQTVIKTGYDLAKKEGLELAVMTFTRHPALLFSKRHPRDMDYLTSLDQKKKLIADLDVDILFQVNFTSSFSRLTPDEFVDQYVVGLGAKYVVAGFDYTFGKKDVAHMGLMEDLSNDRFEVIVVPEVVTDGGQEVSSTKIRHFIKKGQLEQANDLLGRAYELTGYVIHGKARGRGMGYPTANIYPDTDQIIPKIGIYSSRVYVQGQWYNAMTSIGYNVTFGDNTDYTIEAHLFDFDQDIYGEDVRIQWINYIRDEMKFDSVDGLIDQLAQDERVIRKDLFNRGPLV